MRPWQRETARLDLFVPKAADVPVATDVHGLEARHRHGPCEEGKRPEDKKRSQNVHLSSALHRARSQGPIADVSGSTYPMWSARPHHMQSA